MTGKKPYPYQEKLEAHPAPKKIINKSRQMGLSYYCAVKAVNAAYLGKSVLIVSPSERQSIHLVRYVYEVLNGIRSLDQNISMGIVEESKTTIRFESGGAIYSLPNSPNTIRGKQADLIIIDEAALFLNGTDKEVWEAILPSLSRGGEIWLISTPYGERGLFYEIWKDAEKHGFKRFTLNYRECPDLKIEPIKESLDHLSFLQEYENKFLGDVTSFFPYDLLHSCTNPNITSTDGAPRYIGIDVGRRSDFTAISVIEENDGRFSMLHFEKLQHKTFREQHARITELIQTFKPAKLAIDEGGLGMQLAEELLEQEGSIIMPVTFTNENKNVMMVDLKRLFETKEIQIPDSKEIIGALHMIQRVQAGGLVKYESDRSDEHGHADSAWSLALALYSIEKGDVGVADSEGIL